MNFVRIIFFSILAGLIFNPLIFSEPLLEHTEKLRLTSVAFIDNSWYFGVWDGSKNKLFFVKLAAPRPKGGVSVDVYNSETNTALVSTDSGRFIVVMKTPDSNSSEIPQKIVDANKPAEQVLADLNAALQELSESKKTYTQKEVLQLIKTNKK